MDIRSHAGSGTPKSQKVYYQLPARSARRTISRELCTESNRRDRRAEKGLWDPTRIKDFQLYRGIPGPDSVCDFVENQNAKNGFENLLPAIRFRPVII